MRKARRPRKYEAWRGSIDNPKGSQARKRRRNVRLLHIAEMRLDQPRTERQTLDRHPL